MKFSVGRGCIKYKQSFMGIRERDGFNVIIPQVEKIIIRAAGNTIFRHYVSIMGLIFPPPIRNEVYVGLFIRHKPTSQPMNNWIGPIKWQ